MKGGFKVNKNGQKSIDRKTKFLEFFATLIINFFFIKRQLVITFLY